MTGTPTLNIVLYQPEIPYNTGNIIRLCKNTGAILHVIKPLGFQLQSKLLKRAALDYGDVSEVIIHDSITSLLSQPQLQNGNISSYICSQHMKRNSLHIRIL